MLDQQSVQLQINDSGVDDSGVLKGSSFSKVHDVPTTAGQREQFCSVSLSLDDRSSTAVANHR